MDRERDEKQNVRARPCPSVIRSDLHRAVWRGYKELKDAGGWVVLVFAGMGVYRFCKYRGCFNDSTMRELGRLKPRFEVAADTIHPTWRQLLSVVAGPTEKRYDGHPHDWVVRDSDPPIPLKNTYIQWDPHFHFRQLEESIIDGDAWGDVDPRALVIGEPGQSFLCSVCGEFQSDDPQANGCQCHPSVFGGKRGHSPTQVFRTPDGRNNGLVANLVSTNNLFMMISINPSAAFRSGPSNR